MGTITTKGINFMNKKTLKSKKNNQYNEQANKQRNMKLEREQRRETYSFACKFEIFYDLYKRLT